MNLAQVDLNITNDVIPIRLTGKAFYICVALYWNVLLFVFSEAFGTLRSPPRIALVFTSLTLLSNPVMYRGTR